MSRKKKKGDKNDLVAKAFVLITAILNLIRAVLDLIERLLE